MHDVAEELCFRFASGQARCCAHGKGRVGVRRDGVVRRERCFVALCRFVRLEEAVGRSPRLLALAVCACALALSLACISATAQDKEPPPPSPDVPTVEGDLGKKDPTPAPGSDQPGLGMFGLTRLGTAIGLGSRDAEAARSLAEALAREPCDKSLIAKAEAQLFADITAGNLILELGFGAGFPDALFAQGALDDLTRAQATLADALARARAANCVIPADIPSTPATCWSVANSCAAARSYLQAVRGVGKADCGHRCAIETRKRAARASAEASGREAYTFMGFQQ